MNEKTVLDKTGLARLWMHIKVALNQMLTQAKESGEFKGDPGTTPVKGVDYFTDSDKQEIANLVDVTDWFGAGTSIPSGADLNTYTTEGKYHVASTAISNSIVNAPTTNTNYTLFVFVRTTGKSRTQMVVTLNNKMFLRSATSTGTYGAWVEIGSASAPVRGEDYWTEEDKAEIKSYVDEAVTAGKTEPWVLEINMTNSINGTLSYHEEDGTQRTFTVKRKELTNDMSVNLGTLLLELSYDELHAVFGGTDFTSLVFYKDLVSIMNAQDIVNITYCEPVNNSYSGENYNIQGKAYSYYLDELGSLSFAFGRTVIRLSTTCYDQSSGAEEPE